MDVTPTQVNPALNKGGKGGVGHTALLAATSAGSVPVVRALLKAGAQVSPLSNGDSPV